MTHGPITRNATAWALGLMQIRVGPCQSNIASIAPVLTASHSIGALANSKLNFSAEFFDQESGFPMTKDGTIPLREAANVEGAFKEFTPYNLALARGLDPTQSIDAGVTEDVSSVTASGTTTGSISVDTGAGWGVIDEEWTVAFTGATAGIIVGKKTGVVETFTVLTAAIEPVDGSSDKYFSIPANFFSGTWAADESYVFYTNAGGDTTYDQPHSGSLGLGGLVAPTDVRVEGVYTYPNGVNTMTVIMPRAQLKSSMEVDLAEEDAASAPVTFESQNASSNNAAGNAAWDAMPLGRIVWA
jgi:hypothetical protein